MELRGQVSAVTGLQTEVEETSSLKEVIESLWYHTATSGAFRSTSRSFVRQKVVEVL